MLLEPVLYVTILLMVSILIIIFARLVIFFIRKFFESRSKINSPISILSKYPISTKEKLILVKLRNKEILIGVSQKGFSNLSEIVYKPRSNNVESNVKTLEDISLNNKK